MRRIKSTMYSILLLCILTLGSTSCGREKIDAGHVGIKVNLYGSDKGVDEVTEVTGIVWYAPWKTDIFEFPTYVQDVSYDAGDRLKLTTNDGLQVTVEVGLNYRVEPNHVVELFRKYRKPLEELEGTILRKHTRGAFSDAIAKYSAEDSYAKKSELLRVANDALVSRLESEGFTVENVSYLSDPEPPSSVLKNIEAKINASQVALQKEAELAQEEADAQKRIVKAESMAEVKKLEADAEKYSLEARKRSVTELLVQQQMIEKWDGKLPQYGEVPQLFRSVANGN